MVLAGIDGCESSSSIYIGFRNYFAVFPGGPAKRPHCIQSPALRRHGPLAAVFLLLQACLGLDVFAPERRLVFSKPFCRNFFRKSAFVI